MADKKYEKYLTKNIFRPFRDTERQMVSTRHLDDFIGKNFSLDCNFITEPVLMVPKPHKHSKGEKSLQQVDNSKVIINDFSIITHYVNNPKTPSSTPLHSFPIFL